MSVVNIICCSVLRREMEEVLRLDYPDARAFFLDSMLHMKPEKLHRAMEDSLATMGNKPCLLVYGDCHPYMGDMEKRPHCERTAAINCGDLLLGRELYARYRKEKAFLFLPEWTERWREVFQEKLGFKGPSLAGEFMRENRGMLLYVDTGLLPVPRKTIGDIAEYFGMPVLVLQVTLDHLRAAVKAAMERLERRLSRDF